MAMVPFKNKRAASSKQPVNNRMPRQVPGDAQRDMAGGRHATRDSFSDTVTNMSPRMERQTRDPRKAKGGK